MITSMIIMFGYLTFVAAKFGIPKSISETYYLLGKHGWMFQLALFATAFTAIPMLIGRSSEDTQFLAFLGCAGLAFVAAAPLFKFIPIPRVLKKITLKVAYTDKWFTMVDFI